MYNYRENRLRSIRTIYCRPKNRQVKVTAKDGSNI